MAGSIQASGFDGAGGASALSAKEPRVRQTVPAGASLVRACDAEHA